MGRAEETLALGALMAMAFKREAPKVWHSLRHTYASHFVMSGGSILALKELLGYTDIETTLRYAHLAPDHMAEQVAKLNFAAPCPPPPRRSRLRPPDRIPTVYAVTRDGSFSRTAHK
jgi:hypothetical protein